MPCNPAPAIRIQCVQTDASAGGEFRHRIARLVYKAANLADGNGPQENNP